MRVINRLQGGLGELISFKALMIMLMSLTLCLAAMLLAAAFIDKATLSELFRSLDFPLGIALITFSSLNYLFRILRWQYLYRLPGIAVRPLHTAVFYIAGFSMGATPGKLGELIRLWFLERRYQIPYEKTMALFFGDRISDIYAMVIICLIGSITFVDFTGNIIVISLVVILVSYVFVRPAVLLATVGFIYRLINYRYTAFFARTRRAIRFAAKYFRLDILMPTLILGVLAWYAECMAFFWLLDQMNVAVTLNQAAFIYAAASLGGALSMMPGGLIGFEAVALALLSLLGVDLAVSLTAVVIIRLFTQWYSIILGFAFVPMALSMASGKTE